MIDTPKYDAQPTAWLFMKMLGLNTVDAEFSPRSKAYEFFSRDGLYRRRNELYALVNGRLRLP